MTIASFQTDSLTTTFAELEGGGRQMLISMMDEHWYEPYTWKVRFFKEFEINEVTIELTPDGKPHGFIETISENIPRATTPFK